MLVDSRRPVQPVQRGDKELVAAKQRQWRLAKAGPWILLRGQVPSSDHVCEKGRRIKAHRHRHIRKHRRGDLREPPLITIGSRPTSLGFVTEQLKVPRPVVCFDKLTANDRSLYLPLPTIPPASPDVKVGAQGARP